MKLTLQTTDGDELTDIGVFYDVDYYKNNTKSALKVTISEPTKWTAHAISSGSTTRLDTHFIARGLSLPSINDATTVEVIVPFSTTTHTHGTTTRHISSSSSGSSSSSSSSLSMDVSFHAKGTLQRAGCQLNFDIMRTITIKNPATNKPFDIIYLPIKTINGTIISPMIMKNNTPFRLVVTSYKHDSSNDHQNDLVVVTSPNSTSTVMSISLAPFESYHINFHVSSRTSSSSSSSSSSILASCISTTVTFTYYLEDATNTTTTTTTSSNSKLRTCTTSLFNMSEAEQLRHQMNLTMDGRSPSVKVLLLLLLLLLLSPPLLLSLLLLLILSLLTLLSLLRSKH